MGMLDLVIQLPFSWRQRRARYLRDDLNKDSFIAALAANDEEAVAAGLLWQKLVDVAVVSDFRPSPDDNLLYMYGLADEDLDEDIILALINQLGYVPPSQRELERIGQVASPRDLMCLVRQCIVREGVNQRR